MNPPSSARGPIADRTLTLGRHLRDYCNDAKVPRVYLHSLRGLHATLATEAGVSSHAVANALGHSPPSVPHAHYVQPGMKQHVSTRRVAAKLDETTNRRKRLVRERGLEPLRG